MTVIYVYKCRYCKKIVRIDTISATDRKRCPICGFMGIKYVRKFEHVPKAQLFDLIVDVTAWYDRNTHSYIIQKVNVFGDQIGDAMFVATQWVAKRERRELLKRAIVELNEEQFDFVRW